MIPVMSFLTGYFTLKAYKTGLTHNWETKHDIRPTEKPNIIEKVIDNKEAEKANNRVQEIIEGYMEW